MKPGSDAIQPNAKPISSTKRTPPMPATVPRRNHSARTAPLGPRAKEAAAIFSLVVAVSAFRDGSGRGGSVRCKGSPFWRANPGPRDGACSSEYA
jgi:hypothetical protein